MRMTRKAIYFLLLLIPYASGFAQLAAKDNGRQTEAHSLQALQSHDHEPSKRQHTASFLLPVLLSAVLAVTPPAWADDEIAATPDTPVSIAPCRKNPGETTNCVSTGNVKQLDLYVPPWTFDSSAEEAAARLKGVFASDPNLELLTVQDALLFEIKATRSGGIFTDNIQFLINPQDKVITFRAEQDGEPSVSDFGAIRKELEGIRQRSKSFGVMGQGITADTMPSQNGPGGQLKAFFGLQSGRGFEEVFEE